MSEPTKHRAARVRSPAYPAFDLKAAIDKANTIYAHEKRAAAPVGVVTKHCGLDIKSSGALRLIAALKQFGLAVEQGSGEDREVKLSDTALDIVLAPSPDDAKRIGAIKRAALSPKIHKHLWDYYNGELPSDGNIRAYLLREMEFNDAKVDRFIKEFRSTIAFAKLTGTDIIPTADGFGDDDDAENGIDEQYTEDKNRQHRRRPMQSGMKEDVFTLDEGQVVLQWPENLSQASFEDFESWLELVIRKVKRSVQSEKRHDATSGGLHPDVVRAVEANQA
jgi:hypothetical protein